MRAAIILLVLASLVALWTLRPVCVGLTDEDLRRFDPPIATRTDRDFHVRVFQQRPDGWYHCKTWLSRQFFF